MSVVEVVSLEAITGPAQEMLNRAVNDPAVATMLEVKDERR